MKFKFQQTILFLGVFTSVSFSYPELCMPDHKEEYVAAFSEAKTGIDKFWQSSGTSCKDVGAFLDFFELKEPPFENPTEKELCSWAGTAHGVALFSHQREIECGVKKCEREGSYIGRKIAKTFCATFELYTSSPSERFMKDIERPVCHVIEEQCVSEAEIYSSIKCKLLKAKYPAVWKSVLDQTCR